MCTSPEDDSLWKPPHPSLCEAAQRTRAVGGADRGDAGGGARGARLDGPSHGGQTRHRTGAAPPDLPVARGPGEHDVDPVGTRQHSGVDQNRAGAALAHRRDLPGKAGPGLGAAERHPLPARRFPRRAAGIGPAAARGVGRDGLRRLPPVAGSPAHPSVRQLGRRRPGRAPARHGRGH